jgi:hypothetical protein
MLPGHLRHAFVGVGNFEHRRLDFPEKRFNAASTLNAVALCLHPWACIGKAVICGWTKATSFAVPRPQVDGRQHGQRYR